MAAVSQRQLQLALVFKLIAQALFQALVFEG
jgi:hypothetical protein